jgi:hypothetical protein
LRTQQQDQHQPSPDLGVDLGVDLDTVRTLHTLGPPGTNLESAAHEWFRRQGRAGRVELHPTLESALPAIPADGAHALVACAVYPQLHELVFGNLDRLRMVDSFIFPTHNMVLASRSGGWPAVVASHPAPRLLAAGVAEVRPASSNSQAAADCRAGLVDGCVTTLPAAHAHGLHVVRDFGAVPMVFTVHHVMSEVMSEVWSEVRPASEGDSR